MANSNKTKIKLCGLRRAADIQAVNQLLPEYIGFVFVKDKRRYIDPSIAKELKATLDSRIKAVGVFIDEHPSTVASLVKNGAIDVIQLHGSEDEEYISRLRKLTDAPVIKAFRIKTLSDIDDANASSADLVLLDSGAGTGKAFDWSLLRDINRPFFLAGGLTPQNVSSAISELAPFGVDVSSGIETDGFKDKEKMTALVAAVRKEL